MMREDDITTAPPIPNSYWVIPGRLVAGEHPNGVSRVETLTRLKRLVDAGVTSFIDLTEQDELPPYDGLLAQLGETPPRYRRWPIVDHSVPESAERMSRILDYLDAELAAGRCVYVHCRAGIGRTGTTIACHLIRSGLPNDEALERLQRLWRACARSRRWPSVPETEEQKAFVREWRDRVAGVPEIEPGERSEGAVVGLALGDALGALADAPRGDAAMLDEHVRGLDALTPGAETAMLRALGESLLTHRRHVPDDQLERYRAWLKTANAPVSPEFKRALAVWQWSKKPHAGSHDPKNLDPHTLARTLAVALCFRGHGRDALELGAESSRTTQQSPIVLDLCRLWTATWLDVLAGAPKVLLLRFAGPAATLLRERKLKPQVLSLMDAGEHRALNKPQNALEVTQHALACFAAAGSFAEAMARALTPGNPTAAVLAGALAGGYFGIEAVPRDWRAKLTEEAAALRMLAHQLLG
jgi:ADP-ribosylglycohydrolase